MTSKLSILIFSQEDLLFKLLGRNQHADPDLQLYPVKQAEAALYILNDASIYPLVLIADESAEIQVLKQSLLLIKHQNRPVTSIYTGKFSSKKLEQAYHCGFNEFLAAPVNLNQIIQLASKKGLAPDIKKHFNTTNSES